MLNKVFEVWGIRIYLFLQNLFMEVLPCNFTNLLSFLIIEYICIRMLTLFAQLGKGEGSLKEEVRILENNFGCLMSLLRSGLDIE